MYLYEYSEFIDKYILNPSFSLLGIYILGIVNVLLHVTEETLISRKSKNLKSRTYCSKLACYSYVLLSICSLFMQFLDEVDGSLPLYLLPHCNLFWVALKDIQGRGVDDFWNFVLGENFKTNVSVAEYRWMQRALQLSWWLCILKLKWL